MSWGIDLWDQYDNVAKHTDKGIDFLEKYSSFLKKRSEIEISYAAELKRLVKTYQPKKKDEDDNQFSWAKSFQDMLKELHDLAGQHEVIAETTQAQLITDIQKCVQEYKTDRRKFLQDGSKLQSQLRDSISALEKTKKNYDKKFSDSERALDAYRKADADINLSRAEVEKTRMISNKKAQESEESKNEYAAQLQTTNQLQRDFYTSLMPQVFQNLKDLDIRRINKVKSVIRESASLEQNVLPIINTCIEGMIRSSDAIDPEEDSKIVINKYKTGFPIPDDIPFENLANGPQPNSNSVIKSNLTPDPKINKGTIGGGKPHKKRGGIFKIFGSSNPDEQREDFSNIPPAQRKAKLLKRIDEIRKSIAHESAEREGMSKMKEVYENNPALGDPNSLNKKLEQNTEKINTLQVELRKFNDLLADAEGEMSMKRRGSDDSMTHSITSEGSVNNQVSAPGTPIQLHNQDEYYDHSYRPVEEPMDPQPEPGTPDNADDEFGYPVIGTCRALYAFDAVPGEASNDGSVSMVENEEMLVLEQDQGDGWTRVRKADNSEGFVPTSYIQCHFYDQDAV